MKETDYRSIEQKQKEAESRLRDKNNRDTEEAPGFGNKKLEGPDRPST